VRVLLLMRSMLCVLLLRSGLLTAICFLFACFRKRVKRNNSEDFFLLIKERSRTFLFLIKEEGGLISFIKRKKSEVKKKNIKRKRLKKKKSLLGRTTFLQPK
jgi:hypothetical protein